MLDDGAIRIKIISANLVQGKELCACPALSSASVRDPWPLVLILSSATLNYKIVDPQFLIQIRDLICKKSGTKGAITFNLQFLTPNFQVIQEFESYYVETVIFSYYVYTTRNEGYHYDAS